MRATDLSPRLVAPVALACVTLACTPGGIALDGDDGAGESDTAADEIGDSEDSESSEADSSSESGTGEAESESGETETEFGETETESETDTDWGDEWDDEDDFDTGTLPEPPEPTLNFLPTKRFAFWWDDTFAAESYQLFQLLPGAADPQPLGEPSTATNPTLLNQPLFRRLGASYHVRACNLDGCTDSDPTVVDAAIDGAIGHVKASNAQGGDWFGWDVALSLDGQTMAVSARREDGGVGGVGGDPNDESIGKAGAVYIFVRDAQGEWSEQAYIKSPVPKPETYFGEHIALSGDGNTLAVASPWEKSDAVGIGGDPDDHSAQQSGAAFVYVRGGPNLDQWSFQEYFKASNAEAYDRFGMSVALSGDGDLLAVGATGEDSLSTGFDGPMDNGWDINGVGAVYLFERGLDDSWVEAHYVKASNAQGGDNFGEDLSISADGDTFAVSARYEDSGSGGVNGDQDDNSVGGSGAVYVFHRPDGPGSAWAQEAYVKASHPTHGALFGNQIRLSADGDTLAVSSPEENSGATGMDGDPLDTSADDSGAVFLFRRDPMNQWSQQAYIKASNTGEEDFFGAGLGLSADGNVLAVGAHEEDSAGVGIDSAAAQDPDELDSSGAAYVFAFEDGGWSQVAYLKAPNADDLDDFGFCVALSGDGETLAVGAYREDDTSVGVNNPPEEGLAFESGAVFLY